MSRWCRYRGCVIATSGKIGLVSVTMAMTRTDGFSSSFHSVNSLLTVAGYTYSSDQRFRAVHKPYFGEQPPSLGETGSGKNLNSDLESLTDTYQDWGLEIHSSHPRDSGIYECQISTTPHRSLFVHLRVVGKLSILVRLACPDIFRPWRNELSIASTDRWRPRKCCRRRRRH